MTKKKFHFRNFFIIRTTLYFNKCNRTDDKNCTNLKSMRKKEIIAKLKRMAGNIYIDNGHGMRALPS